MKELIQQYKKASALVANLRNQLEKSSDGYIYLTCLRCYGSIQYYTYNNEFVVQQLCDEYYGENGIVDVYTSNPNNSIQTYGDVTVMSIEEIQAKATDNISMSRAINNWIAHIAG